METLNFKNLSEVKKANKENGLFFFSKKAIHTFSSKIETDLLHDRYFITSEIMSESDLRIYKIREVKSNRGDIICSPFPHRRNFATIDTAKDFLKEYVETHEAEKPEAVPQPTEKYIITLPFFAPDAALSSWDGDTEVSPVFDNGEFAEVCEPGQESYWSVYLHQNAGGVLCVADLATEEQANALSDLITNAVKSFKERKEDINFKEVNPDGSGNRRQVCHFLNIAPDYATALKLAKKIGGSKFNNKQYGGGIVFYAHPQDLEKLTEKIRAIQVK